MDLSIIIVSWNTVELLVKCLESVFAYPPDCTFEVLVVDNASADATVQTVKNQFPQVKLMPNQENVGFAPANNQAIRQSSGRYVLLLNPDTEVKQNALTLLVQYLESNPAVGAVGPLTLNPDDTLQTSCYPRPTLVREFWRLFHLDSLYPYGTYHMSGWSQNEPHHTDTLLGACLLVRRQILDKIGLLDEDYFIFSEEIDLCYRIQQEGSTLFWVPQAQIIHYGGQSTKQVAPEMFMRLYESKVIYFQKHYSWLTVQGYKLVIMAASLLRLLASPLVFLGNSPNQQERFAVKAQYYRRLMGAILRM